jgi:hypothetical protein
MARAVNRGLVTRNWLIGAHLVEFEQQGKLTVQVKRTPPRRGLPRESP